MNPEIKNFEVEPDIFYKMLLWVSRRSSKVESKEASNGVFSEHFLIKKGKFRNCSSPLPNSKYHIYYNI